MFSSHMKLNIFGHLHGILMIDNEVLLHWTVRNHQDIMQQLGKSHQWVLHSKTLCSQKDEHGNTFPCRTRKCSVLGCVVCELCTEMCFRVGTCSLWVMHSKNLCSQKDGHGNVFPCRTRKCVSVLGRLVCELFTPKICAVKWTDRETRFRVGHGYVFLCQEDTGLEEKKRGKCIGTRK